MNLFYKICKKQIEKAAKSFNVCLSEYEQEQLANTLCNSPLAREGFLLLYKEARNIVKQRLKESLIQEEKDNKLSFIL